MCVKLKTALQQNGYTNPPRLLVSHYFCTFLLLISQTISIRSKGIPMNTLLRTSYMVIALFQTCHSSCGSLTFICIYHEPRTFHRFTRIRFAFNHRTRIFLTLEHTFLFLF